MGASVNMGTFENKEKSVNMESREPKNKEQAIMEAAEELFLDMGYNQAGSRMPCSTIISGPRNMSS